MATVGLVKICLDCKGELPSEIPQFCPHCGSDASWNSEIRKKEALLINKQKWPLVSVHGQYLEAVNLVRNTTDPEIAPQKAAHERDLGKALVDSYRYGDKAQKVYILADTLGIMKQVMHSGLSAEEMNSIIKLGLEVGKVAEAADKFIRAIGLVPKE